MKKLIYLLLLLLNGLTSYSQNLGKDVSYYEKPFKPNIKQFYGVSSIHGKSLTLNADTGTARMSSVIYHPSKPRTSFVHLDGASKVFLTSGNIKDDSLKYFRYTVIQDDTIYLAKDLMLSQVGSKGEYSVNFGPYTVANKKISIFIYEVGKKEKGWELIIYCKKLKAPEIVEAKLEEVYNDERVIKLEKNSKGDTTSIERAISQARNLNIHGSFVPMNPNYSFARVIIKPIDNIFLYKILIKRTDGSESEITEIEDLNWKFNLIGNLSCKLDAKNFEKPGKYEIIICLNSGNANINKIENATRINFEMARPSLSTKQLGMYALLVFFILVTVFIGIVFAIKRKNKKKLLVAQQLKSITQMQLNAVRSQLNPHFMFNALAGIQSLMNKNKTEEANEYLGKFARITRSVLDNQELISLAEEKSLLDDYLQMEQFRFGFTYQMEVEGDLDLENTEIPSMLLQPFVENAVKHGIADNGFEGKIAVFFKQDQSNLILEITDNGQGFDSSKKYPGLGLQLSEDRIALLNNIYKETPFTLAITSNVSGTTITITLVNWL